MAIVRVKLSGNSTHGQPIGLSTGAASTIHASTTAANTSDELHVWFVNNNATAVTGTLFMGATGTVPGVIVELPANSGAFLIAPGWYLASGITAFGTAGSTLVQAYGFVNRLTTGA